MYPLLQHTPKRAPWNKGKLVGQKPPLRLQEIWAIRIRLQIDKRYRDLALFNLAIDSKLRACDLLKLRVSDVSNGERVASRAVILQQKTRQPVQFEITSHTRDALCEWIRCGNLSSSAFLFPSRLHRSPHLSTRQYARIVEAWVAAVGLDPAVYGTHSLRRTKASLIYRKTKNLEPYSSCSGIPSSKVRFAISELKWMMPWRWPNKPRYNTKGPSPDGRFPAIQRLWRRLAPTDPYLPFATLMLQCLL